MILDDKAIPRMCFVLFLFQSQCSVHSGYLKPVDNNNKNTANNLISPSSKRTSMINTAVNCSLPKDSSSSR